MGAFIIDNVYRTYVISVTFPNIMIKVSTYVHTTNRLKYLTLVTTTIVLARVGRSNVVKLIVVILEPNKNDFHPIDD